MQKGSQAAALFASKKYPDCICNLVDQLLTNFGSASWQTQQFG